MTVVAYVDASALVKLVVPEAQSGEMLRWYVEVDRVITSRIGVIGRSSGAQLALVAAYQAGSMPASRIGRSQ